MFMKLAKHKTFDYIPRVYNPQKDESYKTRIRFRSLRQHRRKSYSFIWMLALFFFVVYLIILLSKIAHNF